MVDTMASTFWVLGCAMLDQASSMTLTALRRYRAVFGISPGSTSVAWSLTDATRPSTSRPKHLLWCLMFLKVYASEGVHCCLSGADEKTFRKWVWLWVDLLANLRVIVWDRRFELSRPHNRAFVSLDGTDFRIWEPVPYDRKWYSHKFHGAGLRYEVGVCMRTGNIVWVNGGVPCGEWPDLRLARDSYVHCVRQGEITYADKGYRDANYFYFNHAAMANPQQHKDIMCRHETMNKRLKQFKILGGVFRHVPYTFIPVVSMPSQI
ncbi:hypothetical protein AaE_013498 [Aphanomyces astaci]|uniref:DDE Tnp4 domain-containing protein n=1 Tax=Aphanomyces astaci TaxID=112090 RepID=A0A6A4ZA59_APHAT|nr:hypothetical protein AaE_013498 [Aphanomyces astaci]